MGGGGPGGMSGRWTGGAGSWEPNSIWKRWRWWPGEQERLLARAGGRFVRYPDNRAVFLGGRAAGRLQVWDEGGWFGRRASLAKEKTRPQAPNGLPNLGGEPNRGTVARHCQSKSFSRFVFPRWPEGWGRCQLGEALGGDVATSKSSRAPAAVALPGTPTVITCLDSHRPSRAAS